MSSNTKAFEEKMKSSVEHLDRELAAVRAGRANPAVLDKVSVDYYGAPTPIQQVASVAVSEARTLTITPWDRTLLRAISKAIMASDVGITPIDDGSTIRLNFPAPTEERRKQLAKEAAHSFQRISRTSTQPLRKSRRRSCPSDRRGETKRVRCRALERVRGTFCRNRGREPPPRKRRRMIMNHPKEFAEGLSIGIIMDGNGRWAKQRGLPRTAGHKKGAAVFQDIANYCEELGVSSVTFYAFSTENWKRPLEEVSAIMKLFGEYLLKGFNYKDRNIRIKFLGDRAALDAKLQKLMNELEEDSAAKTGMTLNIAVNYGGRPEIVRAARQLAQQVAEGTLKPEDITEEMMSDHMYTAGQKDPDFILRPSGEKRLSNFMLWQAAYAELVEMDVLWPDFTRDDLDAAITEFNKRSRRFGGI